MSVNQDIGTSYVPRKVEKEGTHDVSIQGGTFEWGVDTMNNTMLSGGYEKMVSKVFTVK